MHHIFCHTIPNPAPLLSSTLLSFYLSVPSHAPQIQPHEPRWLYPTLSQRCASIPSHYSTLHHIPVSHPAPAGVLQLPPLVACEGRADGDILEDGVSADEVHSKRQVVRSHPLQFCCAETRATLQLPDASLFRGT